MWPGNLRGCLIETGSRIPTDKVKGIPRGQEGFLKELIDGEWKFREDAPKEGKTSREIRKDKSGMPEKAVKKRSRLKPCTRKLLTKAKETYPKGHGCRVLRALWRRSWYGKEGDYKYVSDTRTHSGSYYSYGQEWLAHKLKIRRKTVSCWLKRFEEDGYVYCRYHGYPDRGNSLLELAYNEKHRQILQGKNTGKAK